MADIIDSRKTDQNKLITELKMVVDAINGTWKRSILSPLTITLGDEFQCIVMDIETSFKLVFEIEEFIIARSLQIKLRYVINYGKIETPINGNIAYEMLGSGLTQAREQLNLMKPNLNRFRLLNNTTEKSLHVLNDLFFLYISYIDSWKSAENQMISEFLNGKDYKIVAAHLGMNKSSTWRRFKTLKIEEYNTTKNLILTLNKML